MPKDEVITCSLCPKCGKPLKLVDVNFADFRYICENCDKKRGENEKLRL